MELHMNPFKGRHFQRDIILWAVRWYCKYGISYRELQEMLAERGVNVDHSTIYRWVQRYAPEMEGAVAKLGQGRKAQPQDISCPCSGVLKLSRISG